MKDFCGTDIKEGDFVLRLTSSDGYCCGKIVEVNPESGVVKLRAAMSWSVVSNRIVKWHLDDGILNMFTSTDWIVLQDWQVPPSVRELLNEACGRI